jgi:hypothetical protein
LRTKVNHITDIKDRPNIPNNSLVAAFDEIERFQLKQHEFWNLYKKYGEEEPLIAFEDFLNDPEEVIHNLNCWPWWDMYEEEKKNLTLTISLDINYKTKFKNYDQIRGWFNG